MKIKKMLLIIFALTSLTTSLTLIEAHSGHSGTVVQVDVPIWGIWIQATSHAKTTSEDQQVDLVYVEKDSREICVDLVFLEGDQVADHCGFEGDVLIYDTSDHQALETYYYYARTKKGSYFNKTIISTSWTFD